MLYSYNFSLEKFINLIKDNFFIQVKMASKKMLKFYIIF